MLKPYVKLMRIHHYIKNLLVFAALAFSGQFFVWEKLFTGIIGFASFCMISSTVYIINDICDRKKDQGHPVKRNRPIASGEVSVKNAKLLVFILLFGSIILQIVWRGREKFHILSFLLLILYLAINLAYSFGWKNIPILDISILAAGFLIRVMYGAILTGVTVSNWLYFTVMTAAFYFALGKRRNELRKMPSVETRNVLKEYPVDFLDKNMYVCLTLMNVFYALWSMDKGNSQKPENKYLVFTVPIILIISFKYSMDIEDISSDGDPVEVLLHDKALLILCAIYFVMMFTILYL